MAKSSSKPTPNPPLDTKSEGDKHSHDFTDSEEGEIRSKLLEWYDKNLRDLPWRQYSSEEDPNKRGYAVWVSEIMLQQTQVATVIDYYNRWMGKWPTMEDLAKASLEEVNECWSGMGYYSRGRRLHEGCKKVCEDLGGNMPTTALTLRKELPGVGRYTAGAIASIAYKEPTGIVDGNVVRVLSRLRGIGADSTSNIANEKFWQLANSLVDKDRPGDFNQAMMEFGATLCTPKTPQCDTCVLSKYCIAFEKVEKFKAKSAELLITMNNNSSKSKICVTDIEDCGLCLPLNVSWEFPLGVCNYPMKAKKQKIKEETFAACVVQGRGPDNEIRFLIVQRPQTGLLAGMWEFPNMELLDSEIPESKSKSHNLDFLGEKFGLTKLEDRKNLGDIVHKFTHRLHKYMVESFCYQDAKVDSNKSTAPNGQQIKWVTSEEFQDAAIPTATRKMFKLYDDSLKPVSQPTKKRKLCGAVNMKNQKTIELFFKPKSKQV